MNPKQIMSWRIVLFKEFGPYALIMPVKEIEDWRDMMQRQANLLAVEEQRKDYLQKKRAKKRRRGLCKHGVAAKYCKVCE